ncbi:MAG: hypothetical protein JJU06_09100 [Ectothiorhodospiraceae bacterium]|nr:hypothetical protein [Ectothiorhodospiraceae bacterium]MCH8504828.1 DUF6484 domain-containing protein [Ectothiorhodospiraceae bacterium]
MTDDLADAAPRQRVAGGAARIDGVVVGLLVGLDGDGYPLVAFPGSTGESATRGRSLVELSHDDIGRELALMFQDGDPAHPMVMGRMHRPDGQAPVPRGLVADADGERLELRADREIVLRCGRASITLTRSGKILLRGAYLLSRSSGVNRIKGGSVQIN